MTTYLENENHQRSETVWEKQLGMIEVIYEDDQVKALGELLEMGVVLSNKNHLGGIYGRNQVWACQQSAYENLGFLEMLAVYISFVSVNDSQKAYREYGDVLRNFVRKLDHHVDTHHGELQDRDKWLIGIFFEQIRGRLDTLRAEEISGEVAISLENTLINHPEIRPYVAGLVAEMTRSTYLHEKEKAFDCINNGYDPIEAYLFMAEYFDKPGEQDTFFADKAIEVIEKSLARELKMIGRWEDIEEGSKTIIAMCLGKIEESLVVATERGHQEFILSGVSSLVLRFPELQSYLSVNLACKLVQFGNRTVQEVIEGDHVGKLDKHRRYGFLKRLFDGLTTKEQEELLAYIVKDRCPDELDLLRNIYSSEETDKLIEANFIERGERYEIYKCIAKNRFVLELMSLMVGKDKYRFQLGVLLSMLDFNDLPVSLKKKIDPEWVESNQTLKLRKNHWSLCDSAEERMVDAMYTKAILLINGNMLLKLKGKLSALCLRTFTTRKGFTFVEGNWYSPVDEGTRDELKSAYFYGRDTTKILDSSEWVLMRTITGIGDRSSEEMFREIKRIAGKIELSDIGGKYNKKDYRYMVSQEDD